MSLLRPVVLGLGVAVLASCSWQKQQAPRQEIVMDALPEDPDKPRMGFEDPAESVMNPLRPGEVVDPNAQSYNVSTSEELEQIDNGAQGEVYFTDPDNPDAEIEGITNAFETLRSGNVWLSNYGRATRYAHRECRPLIIWFHDSVIAPKSAELGVNLLETPEFNEWCRDRVVRVKLDSGADLKDHQPGATARYSREAIERLARRYGLRKRPALAVVSPQGKFVLGIDGHDDYTHRVDALLKEGVIKAEQEMEEYREKLRPKGYRTWTSATGEISLFGKLQRYNDKKQLVILKEYGGKITRVKLQRLCKEDREYVLRQEEEKEERKAEKRRNRRKEA